MAPDGADMTRSDGVLAAAAPDIRTVFYCVGAQKAATTWLAEMLAHTPDCHVARGKELHYWTMRARERGRDATFAWRRRQVVEGLGDLTMAIVRARMVRRSAEILRWRLGQFAMARDLSEPAYVARLIRGRKAKTVVGEMTPDYALLDRDWLRRMGGLHADTRMFFVMRDPVDRLWSGIRHSRIAKSRHDPADDARLLSAFDAAIDNPRDHHRRRSEYRPTVEGLDAILPPERVAYFYFDSIRTRPELDRLATFLGIAEIPLQAERRVNRGVREVLRPSEAQYARARAALDPVYRFVASRFGMDAVAGWRPAANRKGTT